MFISEFLVKVLTPYNFFNFALSSIVATLLTLLTTYYYGYMDVSILLAEMFLLTFVFTFLLSLTLCEKTKYLKGKKYERKKR